MIDDVYIYLFSLFSKCFILGTHPRQDTSPSQDTIHTEALNALTLSTELSTGSGRSLNKDVFKNNSSFQQTSFAASH